jgi:hypothetical protein
MPALDAAGQTAFLAATQRGLTGAVGALVSCEFPAEGKGRGRFYAILKSSGLAAQDQAGLWSMDLRLAADAAKHGGVFNFLVLTNTPLIRLEGTTQYAQCAPDQVGAILVVNTVAMSAEEEEEEEEEEVVVKPAKRQAKR